MGWTGQSIMMYKQRHNDHVQVQHLHKDEAGRGLGGAGGDCPSGYQTQCGEGKEIALSARSTIQYMNRDLQSLE